MAAGVVEVAAPAMRWKAVRRARSDRVWGIRRPGKLGTTRVGGEESVSCNERVFLSERCV